MKATGGCDRYSKVASKHVDCILGLQKGETMMIIMMIIIIIIVIITEVLQFAHQRWWRIQRVERHQVGQLPVTPKVLQGHSVHQAGEVCDGLCKPLRLAEGLRIRCDICLQGSGIHEQGLRGGMWN